jgi:hypothetical protein
MALGPSHLQVLEKVAQRHLLEYTAPEHAPLWLDQGGAEARTLLLSKVAAAMGEQQQERKGWARRHPVATGLGLAAGAAGLGAGGYLLGRHRGTAAGMASGLKKGKAQGILEGAAKAREQVLGSTAGNAANKVVSATEKAKEVAGKAKQFGRDILDMVGTGGRAARRATKLGV